MMLARRLDLEHLDDIYRRVGLFVTEQVSITKPGSEGLGQIRAVMTKFRATPPTEIANHRVEQVVDLAKPSVARAACRRPTSWCSSSKADAA